MAARFWVGGTGNWDATTTTHWATTSNGAGGAAVPVAGDTVTFDANSGAAATVTITAATPSLSTVTINKSDLTLLCNAALNVNATSTLTLTSGTLNTNGQACSWGLFFSAGSVARTLAMGASAITLTGTGTVWNTSTSTNMALTYSAGASVTATGASVTINLGGGLYQFTLPSFILSGSGTPVITGAGTFANFTRTGTAVKTDSLVIGTDTILSVTGALTLTGNSVTNRLLVNSSSVGSAGTFQVTSGTAPTLTYVDFMDVTIATTANLAPNPSFEDDTGAFVGNGTVSDSTDFAFDGARSMKFVGNGSATMGIYRNYNGPWDGPVTAGSSYTLSAYFRAGTTSRSCLVEIAWYDITNATLSTSQGGYVTDVSTGWTRASLTATAPVGAVRARLIFSDGATIPSGEVHYVDAVLWQQSASLNAFAVPAVTGTSLGNCGGNSGIAFDASVAQTWSGTSGGTWSANAWTTRVPLPQDDVTISSAFIASQTINIDMPRACRSLSLVGTTGSPTITVGSTLMIYGNLTLVAGVSWPNTFTLAGRGSQTLTSAGVAFPGSLNIQAPGGTYQLQDNLSARSGGTSNTGIQVIAGTFDANGHNVTTSGYSANAGALTLMGSGTWTLNGTGTQTVWGLSPGSVTPSTSTIVISDAGANAKTFIGASNTYNNLSITGGGAGSVTITGANTFNTLTIGAPKTVILPASTITTCNVLSATGTSVNPIAISSSTSGTPATLNVTGGIVSCDWLGLKDSNATGGAIFNAGANSTNTSGNSGWIFDAWDGTPGHMAVIR